MGAIWMRRLITDIKHICVISGLDINETWLCLSFNFPNSNYIQLATEIHIFLIWNIESFPLYVVLTPAEIAL